jgi:hypothetical protein
MSQLSPVRTVKIRMNPLKKLLKFALGVSTYSAKEID